MLLVARGRVGERYLDSTLVNEVATDCRSCSARNGEVQFGTSRSSAIAPTRRSSGGSAFRHPPRHAAQAPPHALFVNELAQLPQSGSIFDPLPLVNGVQTWERSGCDRETPCSARSPVQVLARSWGVASSSICGSDDVLGSASPAAHQCHGPRPRGHRRGGVPFQVSRLRLHPFNIPVLLTL